MLYLAPINLQFIWILSSTVIATALLLYIFEGGENIIEFLYIQMANLFSNSIGCSKFSARIMIFGFWTLIIIFSETYISIIARILIAQTGSIYIYIYIDKYETAEDLSGEFIPAQQASMDIAYGYEANSIEIENSGISDLYSLLINEGTDSILIDHPTAIMIDLLYCDLHFELEGLVANDFGLMFGPQMDDQLIHKFNSKIIQLRELKTGSSNLIDEFLDEYYKDSRCERKWRVIEIGIIEMKELWYILLSMIGLALLYFIIQRIYIKYYKNSEKHSHDVKYSIQRTRADTVTNEPMTGETIAKSESSAMDFSTNSILGELGTGEEEKKEIMTESNISKEFKKAKKPREGKIINESIITQINATILQNMRNIENNIFNNLSKEWRYIFNMGLNNKNKKSSSLRRFKWKRETVSNYYCPITSEIMKDPVIAEDGITYEREAILYWLTAHQISPTTRLPMSSQLIPNTNLKILIDISLKTNN